MIGDIYQISTKDTDESYLYCTELVTGEREAARREVLRLQDQGHEPGAIQARVWRDGRGHLVPHDGL